MELTEQQANGEACVVCHRPGCVEDNVQVGICDGTPIWACPGGCRQIASDVR